MVGQENAVEVVTTPQTDYDNIDIKIIHYLEIQSYLPAILSLYIPYNEQVRVKTCFNCLLCIRSMNRPTKYNIYRFAGYSQASTIIAVKHLLKCGFIRVIGKPRLIKPFQKYKVDTGYVITALGEATLMKILSHSKK